MRALSVRQPFAEMIRDGDKLIEFRTFRAPLGELLICSATRVHGARSEARGPLGVARARVHVVACEVAHESDADLGGVSRDELRAYIAECSAKGRPLYAWLLELIEVVEPRPVSGKLGFFDVEFA